MFVVIVKEVLIVVVFHFVLYHCTGRSHTNSTNSIYSQSDQTLYNSYCEKTHTDLCSIV